MAKKEKNLEEQDTTSEEISENTAETVEEVAEKTVEEKFTEELLAEKDKYMRLFAEYDNFRKRSAKERLETFGDATIKTLTDILPVFDNFERAVSAECSDEGYKKGMEMIFNQFKEALKKLGIEEIDPTGQEFNPDFAQAVNQIQDENLGENIVAQTFQKGYKLGDKIIRYAMVVVAN